MAQNNKIAIITKFSGAQFDDLAFKHAQVDIKTTDIPNAGYKALTGDDAPAQPPVEKFVTFINGKFGKAFNARPQGEITVGGAAPIRTDLPNTQVNNVEDLQIAAKLREAQNLAEIAKSSLVADVVKTLVDAHKPEAVASSIESTPSLQVSNAADLEKTHVQSNNNHKAGFGEYFNAQKKSTVAIGA